jgi:hypothetical protein
MQQRAMDACSDRQRVVCGFALDVRYCVFSLWMMRWEAPNSFVDSHVPHEWSVTSGVFAGLDSTWARNPSIENLGLAFLDV